ncbi:aldehyde dehydrogenase family protein [Rhodococcus sp. SGAir0479]|uniref:aldehyde dehydrogenase family protein n=1 Tax=Rhodococcus sp. SGAir0479 TaxID=2567884 RepID=UPI0010CD4EEF|nr:aldehyde dehydrogenase family protein [Rhodococcus sp. SGAir0479]QCQ89764.1 aldehyde dehydrogenase family protein [Rhodococcus sp. SGAir0479]
MTTDQIDTGTIDSAAVDAVADVVAGLRTVYAGGRTRPPQWRIDQLRGIERMLDERENEIVQALAQDLGRDGFDSWLDDISNVKTEAVHARKYVRRWMRRRPRRLPLDQMPALGWVQYEPLGLVLVISPWNYPFLLAVNPLIAALAAGNCAVVKPSELTPATSRLLARLLPRYLDSEAVAVVEGDGHTTQALLAQGFDHAFFTGGTEIGRKILAGAAPHLTPVTLELGGKSPAIVTADADLAVTARRLAWTKVINSGQTCTAPDYVLVERSVRDELVGLLIRSLDEFRGTEPGRGLRVVDERQFDRLSGYLRRTAGTVAVGGGSDRASLTVEPTVLVDPGPDEPVMREEIFGPVLPVLTVDSVDQAIAFVTARPKPLAAYTFTKSARTRRRVLSDISSGGAVVNHAVVQYLAPDLPFGGVGASGTGSYNGRWGFETFSHRKSVLVKTFRPDLRFIYPPYTDRARSLIRRIYRA